LILEGRAASGPVGEWPMSALNILSCSAITAVGLDAFQTCAAIRARVSGLRACVPLTPPQEPLIAGKIPTHSTLRRSDHDWLINLGCRGLSEVIPEDAKSSRLGIVLNLPEPFRQHPGIPNGSALELIASIESRLHMQFIRKIALEEGGGGSILALAYADQMLNRGEVDFCVVGGIDSLINGKDINRLRGSHRLHEPENPEGFVPGEGTAFILVSRHIGRGSLATIVGLGSAMESDSVLSDRYSQGAGLVDAMRQAVRDSGLTEANISFRVSTLNAEHYAAWEAAIAVPRFYKSRRERLPVWYPSTGIGDSGAASGALALVVATLAIAGGYAPGPYAMCEASSAHGLRAACLIGPAAGVEIPPFRAEEGVHGHVLERLNALRGGRC
jgi:hypothetical protein